MSPSGNPFQGAAFANDYMSPVFQPSSPSCGYASYYPQSSPSTPSSNALVLYNPSSLYGLYYNEHVHGPFATGRQINPFTPGLSPVSNTPKPKYATDDPLRDRYPASRLSDDPLNWITESLFNVSVDREHVLRQRQPLRGPGGVGR